MTDDAQTAPPSGISRRRLLGLGAAAAGVAAAGSVLGATAAEAAPTDVAYPVSPAGTTLARTLLHGAPGAGGYRPIVTGPGEPTLVRGDLLGGATRGTGTRTPIVAFST